MEHTTAHNGHYTKEQVKHFEQYLDTQLKKIDIEHPDWEYLRHCMLTMYANPAINFSKAAR